MALLTGLSIPVHPLTQLYHVSHIYFFITNLEAEIPMCFFPVYLIKFNWKYTISTQILLLREIYNLIVITYIYYTQGMCIYFNTYQRTE